MQSHRKEPPRLVLVHHEDGTVQGVITADTVTVDCPVSTTVFDYLLNLQAVYYAWDLAYPTAYQLVAFVQAHILRDDKESVFKCSAFVKQEKCLKL